MAKEIIIKTTPNETQIAIVDNGQLVEFHIENPDNARTLGDIYLGSVQGIRPNLAAAFVDIGEAQQGFLHYSNLVGNLDELLAYVKAPSPSVQTFHNEWISSHNSEGNGSSQGNARNRNRKHGSLDSLRQKQRILVTVTKEAYATKSPRLSTSISLAGRFLVLVPLENHTAVSRKIQSYKERRRLRAMIKMLQPPGFGVIVRTVAEGKDAKAIDTDLKLLLARWKRIEAKLSTRPKPPVKVYEDVSMASSIIRDLFSDDYNRVLVDSPRMYRSMRRYIQAVAPHMVRAVKLSTGPVSVFEVAGVSDQINEVFDTRVGLPSGGTIVIEQTEAMHVIDVNSGKTGRRMKAEETALKVNLEAVNQIARQVRLRDLAGLIVVDFIDLRDERNGQKVVDALRSQLRADRVATNVLPMSEFGIVQITRQRTRPSITSTHFLTGNNRRPVVPPPSPEALTERIEKWLGQHGGGSVHLHVHPFTEAWLKRGLMNLRRRWQRRYKYRIKIIADETLNPGEFKYLDAESGHDITDLSPPTVQIQAQPKSTPTRETRQKKNRKINNKPRLTRRAKPGNRTAAAAGRRSNARRKPKRVVAKGS